METELRGGKDREAVISHRLSLQGKEIPLQKVDSSFFRDFQRKRQRAGKKTAVF